MVYKGGARFGGSFLCTECNRIWYWYPIKYSINYSYIHLFIYNVINTIIVKVPCKILIIGTLEITYTLMLFSGPHSSSLPGTQIFCSLNRLSFSLFLNNEREMVTSEPGTDPGITTPFASASFLLSKLSIILFHIFDDW